MRTTWLEVRCCCQPVKVLGWIQVATSALDAGVRSMEFHRHGMITTGMRIELPIEHFQAGELATGS